jgi:uncharacterized damage-inducible protein DinB
MNLLDAYLTSFDAEAAGTRRLLARVPEGRGDWKPHPKSTALGPLAMHVAVLPRFGLAAATKPEFDFASSTALTLPDFTTAMALVEIFDEAARRMREAVSVLKPDDLGTPWRIRIGEQVLMEEPRIMILWRLTLSHMVHHRGQLTVYLRELGVPLPPLYGPTADER